MVNKINSLMQLSLLVFFTSCTNSGPSESENSLPETDRLVVSISETKLENAGIQTGHVSKHLLSDIVECNGSVEANPNNQAVISPVMEGYLKKIHVQIGQQVKKNQRLATLAHPGYIKLQQEYLETKSQYDFFKEDFKRQGELSLEQAISIKKMQEAQNEFRKIEARLYALRHELAFLGIHADSLHVDNMQSEIWLTSPISGIVSEIDGNIGMLCREDEPLFRIMGTGDPVLHLRVFEKDALKISPDQKIEFSPITDPSKIYPARVISSTSNIDENKLINIHADILQGENTLFPGMYVKARIMVSSDSVYALNRDAVVRAENKTYIFEKADTSGFRAIEIETGVEMDNWIEIRSFPSELKHAELVISGAYYLYAELISEE
jgi:membrane fusion protein, heavy metal efflux system